METFSAVIVTTQVFSTAGSGGVDNNYRYGFSRVEWRVGAGWQLSAGSSSEPDEGRRPHLV